jgi:hypothetical protein
MTAITCLVCALVLLMPDVHPKLIQCAKALQAPYQKEFFDLYDRLQIISGIVMRFLLYFTTIESGYTFSRIVGRVIYLSEQKLLLPDSSAG